MANVSRTSMEVAVKTKYKSPVGSGERFRAMTKALMKKGHSEESAKKISAAAGRKKYGKKKFQSMAAAGRRRSGRK